MCYLYFMDKCTWLSNWYTPLFLGKHCRKSFLVWWPWLVRLERSYVDDHYDKSSPVTLAVGMGKYLSIGPGGCFQPRSLWLPMGGISYGQPDLECTQMLWGCSHDNQIIAWVINWWRVVGRPGIQPSVPSCAGMSTSHPVLSLLSERRFV